MFRLASTFVVERYVLQMVHIKLLRDSENATVQHTLRKDLLAGILSEGFDRPPTCPGYFARFMLFVNTFGQAPADPTRKPSARCIHCPKTAVPHPLERLAYVEAEGLGSSSLFRLFSLSGLF